jgi:hypothetical protein
MNADHTVLPDTAKPVSDPNFPLFAGWPFLRWLTARTAEANTEFSRFYGDGDVHRAYEQGGITGAIARCNLGFDTCIQLYDKDWPHRERCQHHTHLANGWSSIRTALEVLGDAGSDAFPKD